MKSDRLKKFETELSDLKHWMKLGLVPKKDLDKHKQEIILLQEKIEEEHDRLKFLKENGEAEEYIAPKRGQKTTYTEMQTLPDNDTHETAANITETGFMLENENTDTGNSIIEEQETTRTSETTTDDTTDNTIDESSDDDYFNEKNRWSRGGILDPDADDW
jgi:predicted RNase H-like nuclease (RuvC/YqgF family)